MSDRGVHIGIIGAVAGHNGYIFSLLRVEKIGIAGDAINMVGEFVVVEIAIKQHIMVNVTLLVLIPRNQPFVVYKLFLHIEWRCNGRCGVAFSQIVFINNCAQGRRVVSVEDNGFNLGCGFGIPVVAAHVDVLGRDIGKEYRVFLVVQEVVSVHLRLVGGEAHNPFLRLADGVADKTHRTCCHQIGNGQFVLKEGVMFKIKVAHPHHADGFVVAPKHIVADDDRIHGCL